MRYLIDMRYLIVFVLSLLFFVSPASAQTPTNPQADPTCGLPKQGVIVATVTYDLIGNCTQTGTLEIRTANTPNVELTINGNGHTIFNTDRDGFGFIFLYVDDDGIHTHYNKDTTASPNVKVVIKNVTFQATGTAFTKPTCHYDDETSPLRKCYTGFGILAEGTLEMENVTFKNGRGIWVYAQGTASLKNVLFEDSFISNYGFYPSTKGAALHVSKTGSATLNNAVFRDIQRAVVSIEEGGFLSATGCLSFIRVLTHKVRHSGLHSGMGTFSDSSTGPCGDIEIGNKGKAVVPYTLTKLPCGLPASGTLEGAHVYTLDQDCVCVDHPFNIGIDASVTINANGHRIVGCKETRSHIAILIGGGGRLTINNARIERLRLRNYGGYVTIRNSVFSNIEGVAIVNYGWAYLHDTIFEGSKGDSDSNVYYAHGHYGIGRALFTDNVFRNNGPVEVEALAHGPSTRIYLCGDNIIEGLPEGADDLQFALFIAEEGGSILGCPDDQPSPAAPSALVECAPERKNLPENKMMGAIGIIMHKQKCPPIIEIWEVLPNSQGQFALKVSQSDVEAVEEGLIACSSNGRAAVRVGLPEPVRQKIQHSRAYQAVSPRQARDILISLGPNVEGKVNHMVIDHALDGQVLGIVDTRSEEPPCQGANLASLLAAAAPPQPTAIPFAAPVAPQAAREDGSIVHVVRSGDTVWQIGIAYDVHPHKIISLNNLQQLSSRGSYIFPGQELLIRPAE